MGSASAPRTFAGRAATADSEKNRVRHFAHQGSSGREQRSGATAGADAAGKSDLCSVSRIAAVVTTGPDDERGRTGRKRGVGHEGCVSGIRVSPPEGSGGRRPVAPSTWPRLAGCLLRTRTPLWHLHLGAGLVLTWCAVEVAFRAPIPGTRACADHGV